MINSALNAELGVGDVIESPSVAGLSRLLA